MGDGGVGCDTPLTPPSSGLGQFGDVSAGEERGGAAGRPRGHRWGHRQEAAAPAGAGLRVSGWSPGVAGGGGGDTKVNGRGIWGI